MKAKITVCLIIVSMQAGFAQQTKTFNQNASRSNHTRLSLSAGGIFTQNDLLKNGFNVQADAFVPFYRKGWDGSVKGSGFALGANIAVNYAGIKNSSPDNNSVAGRYQVYSATHTVSTSENGNSSGSFSGLVGVQAMFGWGKFHISPLVSTGYSNFTLQGFTQTGTYSANGQSKNIDLVKREKKSSGGMIFKPQLRIGYDITSSLSLFASSAYIMGPELKYTTQAWLPQGGFNQQNMYEPQQMQNGSWSTTSGSEKYKSVEINIGISLAIGKSKGGGAASSSYAAGRLSMTPTTPKQSQGQNFGEKVAARQDSGGNAVGQGASLLGGAVGKGANASAFALPGQPIKGVIVKGGKNPGGNTLNMVTDENGEVTFTATEAGEYKLQFTTPESDGKSISSKGVKASTPTKSKRRRVEVLKSNKTDAPNAIVAGNPIGGIIVKGGKNPSPGNGWGAINVISDDNGEVIFTIAEPGEYKLQITAPVSADNGHNYNR